MISPKRDVPSPEKDLDVSNNAPSLSTMAHTHARWIFSARLNVALTESGVAEVDNPPHLHHHRRRLHPKRQHEEEEGGGDSLEDRRHGCFGVEHVAHWGGDGLRGGCSWASQVHSVWYNFYRRSTSVTFHSFFRCQLDLIFMGLARTIPTDT